MASPQYAPATTAFETRIAVDWMLAEKRLGKALGERALAERGNTGEEKRVAGRSAHNSRAKLLDGLTIPAESPSVLGHDAARFLTFTGRRVETLAGSSICSPLLRSATIASRSSLLSSTSGLQIAHVILQLIDGDHWIARAIDFDFGGIGSEDDSCFDIRFQIGRMQRRLHIVQCLTGFLGGVANLRTTEREHATRRPNRPCAIHRC